MDEIISKMSNPTKILMAQFNYPICVLYSKKSKTVLAEPRMRRG